MSKGDDMQTTTTFVMSPECQLFVAQFKEGGAQFMPPIEDAYTIKLATKKKWFVIYTNPKCEMRALKGFKAKGIGGYTPLSVDWRKQSRRDIHQKKDKVEIKRALMTRYALVELPVIERVVGGQTIEEVPFGLARAIDGVREFVGTSQGPITVSPEIVGAIREREDAGEFNNTAPKAITQTQGKIAVHGAPTVMVPKWVDIGAMASVTNGPFAGFITMIEEILPKEMVKVGITVFGRHNSVEMGLDNLKEVG